jgi:SPOR domain
VRVASEPADLAHGTLLAKNGSVRLELGSVRSAAAARLEWEHIRQKNADLVGAFSAFAVRADLGDKGIYYRIETGPVGSLAAARICGELKQRKVGCVIVR